MATNDIKAIPYGLSDYLRLTRDNYYYVDKTRCIPLIEQAASFFFLIRPRRFGKTLLINMLDAYYDMQCPYIHQNIERIKQYCETNHVPLSLIRVDTLQKAKELPCVFNNWSVFYKGHFETVNLLSDVNYLERILKK